MSIHKKHKPSQARFSRDERGNVAMTFGLMFIPMVATMGLAVDYGRWMHAHSVTRNAMDAAVLAAGRQLQIDSTNVAGALAAAQSLYSANVNSRIEVTSDTIVFKTQNNNTEVTAEGNVWIDTPLLSIIGFDELPVLDQSGSEFSVAEVATSGNSGFNIEISMMLDITGSMAGDKIASMKTAAKELIDIVVADDQSQFTSKVALVPFSQSVNLGSQYFYAVTGEETDSELAALPMPAQPGGIVNGAGLTMLAAFEAVRDFEFIRSAQAKSKKKKKKKKDKDKDKDDDQDDNDNDGDEEGDEENPAPKYDPCAVDRVGADALTDAAPGPGSYVQVYDLAKSVNGHTNDMSCLPSSITVLPLTSDKTALEAKVDSFVASGWTAGAVGTAFAWYMLSPEWAGVWPADSQPASYSDEKTKKIAILMTDGEYNTWYNGNVTASEQAVALCTNMKEKGITVFTVGFALGGNETAIETLASCATDAQKAYLASNGSELRQAFRDIAITLTNLYLSK